MQRADAKDQREELYRCWPLRQRLERLAFDARLVGVPQALLEVLWEAVDGRRLRCLWRRVCALPANLAVGGRWPLASLPAEAVECGTTTVTSSRPDPDGSVGATSCNREDDSSQLLPQAFAQRGACAERLSPRA